MDTLAYLHLAETYETSTTDESSPEIPWTKNQSGALMLVASFAMGSLNWCLPAAAALKKGHRNPQVASLQQKLRASGYFSQAATGYFGSVTEAAVKRFQEANGLKADGIVGAATLAALESTMGVSESSITTPPIAASKSSLKRGDISDRVMSLQEKLQADGYYQGAITGNFDTATQAAVIQFQQANRLVADGIVGPKTSSVLASSTRKLAASLPQKTTLEPFLTEQPQKPQNQVKIAPQSAAPPSPSQKMRLIKTISGKISPKSVVYSGNGLFFAQNMMYNHTITVYDRNYELVKVIPDEVDLSKYGHSRFKGKYRGAPVEASFSHNGKYAWISNYQMYGPGFNNPGSDKCHPSQKTDKSFLYRINTETLKIDRVIPVGSVPKFVATSTDENLILVSNWCSWDLSVVDINQNQEIKRIKLGPYPRGIVVDAASETAYVAVMGSYNIAKVNLRDFSVQWLRNIGSSPRHLNIDPEGKYLYASLNGEGKIAKISLPQGNLVKKIATGNAPRSMVLSANGQTLYVVNYGEDTVSKVRTSDMKVLQKVKVEPDPIGITYDPQTREVWVACYSGNIMIFQD
ncbi:Peptidoglycan-binding domain 1 [Trichormus variabilis ATCC 29413]|uniref:Peptidoglycan-binding domain 1 n=2 Tax=Anabaena variabilis TaxID=264691 RepID=Q3MEK2_TRIV2|nr:MULTISPECIES: peptidoglycan-binding protein [Nostocaceae]ABA20584.1 Peptidoglycan-binding domain 1 [Trichormus variabilis ATCC 29413]MBC1214007.1 peptidoglycan-binding protein [Trichormus variabilis ARAD]MBC1254315.1 peptidoglycan-binding protein [Trichormus variabilis V5]MBC1269294.1 peptidoglycan-binding protein [Trichormus variabilis FSR]MBC1300773.1 peptidoglycan-binding protein [Trichormus variabilis N2B]